MKTPIAGLLLTVWSIAVAYLAIGALAPAPALPVDASGALFSADRAALHLETITSRPRPLGSPGHTATRAYLQEQIRQLGLKPQVQVATVQWPGPREGWVTFATVRNVLTRLHGERQSHPLLLASHYDSVINSPGAGDAGAGVATLLEILRALVEKPPLATDVVFLFSDAEELGLRGSGAFMAEHPWAEKVKMVINFDARGTGGPTLVYETSEGNGPLIQALAGAGRGPAAFSFGGEIYRAMPFTTDFTVLSRSGAAGFNLGFFAGPTAYHTALDRLDRLSLDSVQQGGETALGLVRRIDQTGIGAVWRGEETVHFPLLGRFLVSFPRSLALMLAVALVVATLVLVALGFTRDRLSLGPFLAAIAGLGVSVVAVGFLARAVAPLVLTPHYRFRLWQGVDSHSWTLLALALLAAALMLLAARGLGSLLGSTNVSAGGVTLWALATLVVCLRYPSAGYLFSLPLLLALPAAVLEAFGREEPASEVRPLRFLALAAAAAFTALLWAPAMAVTAMALHHFAAPWIAGGVALILAGVLASLAQLAGSGRAGGLTAVGLLAASLILAIAVRAQADHGPDNPRPDSLLYAFDADSGQAQWLSFDGAVDPWTSRFLGPAPARAAFPLLMNNSTALPHAPAPSLDAETATRRTATVTTLGERFGPATREVDLQVDWPEEPHRAILALRSNGTVAALKVNGQVVEKVEDATPEDGFRTLVRYFAPPAEGVTLTAELVPATATLALEVLGDWHELPVLDGQPPAPRPADLFPGPGLMVDSTLVYNAVEIPVGSATATWRPSP